jgi:hypothetical protein
MVTQAEHALGNSTVVPCWRGNWERRVGSGNLLSLIASHARPSTDRSRFPRCAFLRIFVHPLTRCKETVTGDFIPQHTSRYWLHTYTYLHKITHTYTNYMYIHVHTCTYMQYLHIHAVTWAGHSDLGG